MIRNGNWVSVNRQTKRSILKFKNRRVESNRLRYWHYSAKGYYFITICVEKLESILGYIKNNEMVLSEYGETVKNVTIRMNQYHAHGIIDWIEGWWWCWARSRENSWIFSTSTTITTTITIINPRPVMTQYQLQTHYRRNKIIPHPSTTNSTTWNNLHLFIFISENTLSL